MKKKFKILSFLVAFVMMLVIGIGTTVSAAESAMNTRVMEEVERYVNNGTLPSWHLNYYQDEGYQAYFWKQVHFNGSLDRFKVETSGEIATHCSWYRSERNETWDYIIDNLDIEPEYLDQNDYLGIYWDSYAYNNPKNGYLYLIWTSNYTPSEFVTLTEFTESGKTYKLYDNQEAMDNFEMNWLDSSYYHYKNEDLTIHITPIGGFDNGGQFGIPLKQKYNFQGFKYGIDEGQYYDTVDPNGYFKGSSTKTQEFDLKKEPKNDGNNIMQLTTHAYDYVTDCEVQSYYDLGFGGYIHAVHFNLSVDPDKIYRVDTKYTISNSNKSWYEFWKPDDSHTITKSLTPDKTKGGFLGLFSYQGFKEGQFSSVRNPSKKYSYELILDYDDNGWAWKIFTGQEYKESDYQKVDAFKILRINYLLDDEVYDVAIKMDTIEGGTYNIFSADLIEDEDSTIHKVKTWTNDLVEKVKDKWESSKWIFFTAIGVVGLVLIIIVVVKVKHAFNILLADPRSGGNVPRTRNKKK